MRLAGRAVIAAALAVSFFSASACAGEKPDARASLEKFIGQAEFNQYATVYSLFESPEEGDVTLLTKGYFIGREDGSHFFIEGRRSEAGIESKKSVATLRAKTKGGQLRLPDGMISLGAHHLAVGYEETFVQPSSSSAKPGVEFLAASSYCFHIRDYYEPGPGAVWRFTFSRERLRQYKSETETDVWGVDYLDDMGGGPFDWRAGIEFYRPDKLSDNVHYSAQGRYSLKKGPYAAIQAGGFTHGVPPAGRGFADNARNMGIHYLSLDETDRTSADNKIRKMFNEKFSYYALQLGYRVKF